MNNDSSNINPWTVVIILLLTIVLAIICVYVADKRIHPIEFMDPDIPKFSANVHWDPYPSVVDITNKYDCNAQHLRKCVLNDPTTLFGCKELAVRCHHFNKDTEYHSDGFKTVIPKNDTSNEGYALAITTLTDSCNPYHGDLVLVATNNDSTEYMLICHCKNPGYIGNDTLLGACTNVYICNGKIDSIDKPLDQVTCVCEPRELNVRYSDGLPVCKALLVHEANTIIGDWTHLVPWKDNKLIDVGVFNATIRDNVRAAKLLDPCVHALDDGSIIPNAEYHRQYKTCQYRDYGVPARLRLLDKFEVPETRDEKDTPIETIDGAISSGEHRSVRLLDRVAGVRMRMLLHTSISSYKTGTTPIFVVLPDKIGLGRYSQFWMTLNEQMIGGRCYGDWPQYHCGFFEYFSRFVNGIPITGFRSCPEAFLWGRNEWEDHERAISEGLCINRYGTYLENDYLVAQSAWRAYGIRFYNAQNIRPGEYNGMISFIDESDFIKHKNVLT